MSGQIIDPSFVAARKQRNRFIRRWDVTDAAAHPGRMLRLTLLSPSPVETISDGLPLVPIGCGAFCGHLA